MDKRTLPSPSATTRFDALKAKAAELRKVKPELSESQAFAKVYEDPANRALANAERSASRCGSIRRLNNSMLLVAASDQSRRGFAISA